MGSRERGLSDDADGIGDKVRGGDGFESHADEWYRLKTTPLTNRLAEAGYFTCRGWTRPSIEDLLLYVYPNL